MNNASTRLFALFFGTVYLTLGLFGLFSSSNDTPEAADASGIAYVDLFGVFATNFLLSCLHLLVGIGGLLATYGFLNSRVFAQSIAVLMGILALLGFLPSLNTAFGLAPLFGYTAWLHALTAAVAAYMGFWAAQATKVRRRDLGTETIKVFEDR